MPTVEGTPGIKEVCGEYDFAVDGGAISTITLRGGVGAGPGGQIPAGSIIMGGFIEVDTAVTSGGAATIAVNSEAAGDLLAAITVAGAPWSTTGRKAIIPVWTAATFVKTTVSRNLTIAVAAFVLTAGKFRVVCFYR
jgi:hypothetical protein